MKRKDIKMIIREMEWMIKAIKKGKIIPRSAGFETTPPLLKTFTLEYYIKPKE